MEMDLKLLVDFFSLKMCLVMLVVLLSRMILQFTFRGESFGGGFEDFGGRYF